MNLLSDRLSCFLVLFSSMLGISNIRAACRQIGWKQYPPYICCDWQSETELWGEKRARHFSLMFIHFRPQWGKQKGMCFSVYVEPEKTCEERSISVWIDCMNHWCIQFSLQHVQTQSLSHHPDRPLMTQIFYVFGVLLFFRLPSLSPYRFHILNSVATLQETGVDV